MCFLSSLKSTFIAIMCVGLTSSVFAQKLSQPELLGTWYAGEDPSEFIYHTVLETVKFGLLPENPDGVIVLRRCSTDLSSALVDSLAFAVSSSAGFVEMPSERIFFAVTSKCRGREQQFWFVPGNSRLDYDHRIPVQKVSRKDWDVSFEAKPRSAEAELEFSRNTSEFIEELNSDMKAIGFLVHRRANKAKIRTVLDTLKAAGIPVSRIQTIRAKFEGYYPGLRTISIKD